MTIIPKQIEVYSEDGLAEVNNGLTLELDGSTPDCPITFYLNEEAVFSLGNHEVSEFIEALNSLVL